jgi:hypothetical protein
MKAADRYRQKWLMATPRLAGMKLHNKLKYMDILSAL